MNDYIYMQHGAPKILPPPSPLTSTIVLSVRDMGQEIEDFGARLLEGLEDEPTIRSFFETLGYESWYTDHTPDHPEQSWFTYRFISPIPRSNGNEVRFVGQGETLGQAANEAACKVLSSCPS